MAGRVAASFYGYLFESSQYFLGYPPLHFILTAVVFKFLGVSYLTIRFLPALYALLLLIFIIIYCYRAMGFLPALIAVSLFASDFLIFRAATYNRPCMLVALLTTLSAVFFLESEKNNSTKQLFLSGFFSGFAMISSYRCIWLFIAFFGYCAFFMRLNGLKKILKKMVFYLLPAILISAPWYVWIMINELRRRIFLIQVLGTTANYDYFPSIVLILRKLLNPLADLYLIMFRYYSPFSIIVTILCIYFLMNFKKKAYQLFLLITALGLMIFNIRGAYNLVGVFPISYIFFGFFIKDIVCKMKSVELRRIIYSSVVIAVFVGFFVNIQFAFHKPDITLDAEYCEYLLEEYTEDGSRIAADPVFVLTNYGDRTILDIGLLIWSGFRRSYSSYEYMIEKIVDADYLILSERKKRWGEMPVAQSIDFQEYLKDKCVLVKIVDDKMHGKFWIYKSQHRER